MGRRAGLGLRAMDLDHIPPQLRAVLHALDHAVKAREPAIRAKVDGLRAKHPNHDNHQLARELIRSTRRRVAAPGPLSGAAPIPPRLRTAPALGPITRPTPYALPHDTPPAPPTALLSRH